MISIYFVLLGFVLFYIAMSIGDVYITLRVIVMSISLLSIVASVICIIIQIINELTKNKEISHES